MATVSAYVLSYNRPEFLCEAVESILRQTVKPSEIIIFDNGSDGNVYERVRPYLDRGVSWIGASGNHPAIWNFRRAIQAAKSEFVFVLHDDDRLCPDFIEKQINFLRCYPDVGAVTCNGYIINEKGERNGSVLRSGFIGKVAEFYRNAAEVAAVYAKDSCLPFSPVVYRSDFARARDLREEFGKVADAVYFCELANVGVLAYQSQLLYECRTHGAQDSSYFPTNELEKLSNYFETEASGSMAQRKVLRQLLRRQYTSRQLVRIYNALVSPPSYTQLIAEVAGIDNQRFSLLAVIRICVVAFIKRISLK